MRNSNFKKEYLALGLKLMPSGKPNHHHWYEKVFGCASKKDTTWSKKKQCHTCCGNKRAYYHKEGCINRREILGEDDYSDLK